MYDDRVSEDRDDLPATHWVSPSARPLPAPSVRPGAPFALLVEQGSQPGTVLEIHGERPDVVAHWRELKAERESHAQYPQPALAADDGVRPFRRRRRRRRSPRRNPA